MQIFYEINNKKKEINLYNDDPGAAWYWPNVWNNPYLTCQEKYDLQYPTFEVCFSFDFIKNFQFSFSIFISLFFFIYFN